MVDVSSNGDSGGGVADSVAWRIPVNHDPATRESLAQWEVLCKAGRFGWDDDHGTSWRRMPTPPQYAPLAEDLIGAGLDPDSALVPDHDRTLAMLRKASEAWTTSQAAEAFVAGLWSAPPAWRSALPGKLIAQQMPDHQFTPWGGNETDRMCEVCGFENRQVQILALWAACLREGTPLDGDPVAYAQTLEWLGTDRPVAGEYDRWALGAVVAVLRSLPAGSRYSTAAEAIRERRILRGTRSAEGVLDDLALIGVLAPTEHPGMFERFSSYRERDARPNERIEVQAPLAWWDTNVGEHGVRTDIFESLFGHLDIPRVALEGPRPPQHPAPKDTVDGGLASRVRALTPPQPKVAASMGDGPVAAGDVWAIRLEPGRWVTAYVHEVRERGRPFGHAEFLCGVFTDMPNAADVDLRVQPRASGRAPTWVHSLDKAPWMRRIAQDVAAPHGDGPRPTGGSWTNAKDLRRLSGWHFDA